MAFTQDQVNEWFNANPNATPDDVAAAVKSLGGLSANSELTDMLASHYNIGANQVTDYYNKYIGGLPTAPVDNTSYVKPSNNPTSGAVRNVVEGDDIDQQIAQRPEEVSHWARNGQYMEQIDDKTGSILDRRYVPAMSNTQLLTTGLSMVPGVAPFVQGLNAINAAKSGNVLGLVSSVAGLSGASDISNAANFANAAKNKDVLGLALSGSNAGGVTDVGGMNVQDIGKLANAVNAAKSGNALGIFNSALGYTQPNANNDYIPIDTGARNLETKDINSSINTGDMQSLQGIFGDTSAQILNDARFTSSGNTQNQTPDYSGQSFNSAFAAARQSGVPTFTWNGGSFTTDLAPAKTTNYDSVGGGRGVQGGPTALELDAYAKSIGRPSVAVNPFASWASSMIPSAMAGTLPNTSTSLASEIPGYSGTIPASTYDQNNSIVGRFADELGLPQEFQRNVSNTLNALPGINLPLGAIGKGVGAIDETGNVLTSAGRYVPGSNAYQASEYATQAARLGADDPIKLFKVIDSIPVTPATRAVTQEALELLSSGDTLGAYKILVSNPSTKASLQNYASARGYQEVSPFQVTEGSKLFNPSQYLKNAQDAFVSNPIYPKRSK
jgi:hypothetical protein